MSAIPNGTKRNSTDAFADDLSPESKRARIQDEDIVDEPAYEDDAQSEHDSDHERWLASTPTRKINSSRKRHFKSEAYPSETTGQRSFLPGLDADTDDEEELDETTNDALAYLRSVR